MHRLIQQKKAPKNSVAPLKIEMEELFDLDVDDDIWLDVGLGYEEDDTIPPLWLSNDMVRTGIRALLDRDRCQEDWARIQGERNAMQEWFHEEWRVVHTSMDRGKSISTVGVALFLITFQDLGADIEYQLQMRKNRLCRLFVAWERTVVGVPTGDNLPEWGPLEEDISMYRAVRVLGGGIEVAEETGFDYDVEFEQEADGLLVEHLDSLMISENYREREGNDRLT
jgi:hypothetical protein